MRCAGGVWQWLWSRNPCRVASFPCTDPLKISFQYNYRKADSVVLVRICRRLTRPSFQMYQNLFRPFRLAIYLVTGNGTRSR